MSELSTPPSEERYVLDVEANGIVVLIDTVTGTREGFMGPDRLLKATACKGEREALHASLAGEAFGGQTTQADAPAFPSLQAEAEKLYRQPAGFLEELSLARCQRLQAMIEEVRTIEDRALALLAEDTRTLTQATELRQRLEMALRRLVSPSGSPESGQEGSPVGHDTPGPLSHAAVDLWRERMTQAFLDVRAGKPHHPRYRRSNERRAS